ncbi:Magnesium and cobalt transport protein corA [Granulibacter bethesdensis]|nr:Magnesium and cobalt transport protein corA [Granulibacter bethesdensis]
MRWNREAGRHAAMLRVFPAAPGAEDQAGHIAPDCLAQAGWIDLHNPTEEEIRLVSQETGQAIPSRQALEEIENSSRLRLHEESLYLSMPLVSRSSEEPVIGPLGMVVNRERLITIRFQEAQVFDRLHEALAARQAGGSSGFRLMVALIEALVDRLADVLEMTATDIDRVSGTIFRESRQTSRRPARADRMLQASLRRIGQLGDRLGKIRDTLLGVGRIVPYVITNAQDWLSDALTVRLESLKADIASLNDYENHLNMKLNFLLDATLGFINIEQSGIVKVLTIVSVAGIPPVLIAGIYGMNFKLMPELDWHYGYPMSLGLMVLSILLTIAWFRIRGWF